MPFSELDDYHPYREITTIDGRELIFLINSSQEELDDLAEQYPEMENEFRNEAAINAELIHRGVIIAPEVAAYVREGEELPNSCALYIDRRLDKRQVLNVTRWISNVIHTPENEIQTEPALSKAETEYLVALALDEMGLSETLQRIRQEDAQKPLDLNAIIRDQLH